MSLNTDVLVGPGILYADPNAGAATTAGSGGTVVSEVTEPILITYDPQKLRLIVDRYGQTVIDFKDVNCTFMLSLKLAEQTLIAKKLFWGDDRVTASGGVTLPGADSANSGESAPYHQFLYVTSAAANGSTSLAAYKHNLYIPRGQCHPAQGATYQMGNVITSFEIDIICTPAPVTSASPIYTFRQAKIDSISNITIVDWDT